jgi:hypothetical protein
VLRSFNNPPPSVGESPSEVRAYASYEDILTDHYAVYDFPGVSRLTATPDRLYGTSHATTELAALALPIGTRLESIPLQRENDLVNGIAVTDDGLLAITRFVTDGTSRVEVFDVESGARLREFNVPGFLTGLACLTRR